MANLVKSMKKLYLAHSITGLSADEVFDYYDGMAKTLGESYNILSPMLGKDSLRTEREFKPTGYQSPITKDHAIFERDTWMVSQSDVVLCDFRGAPSASIGCCMELAIASWLHKHVIVVMDETNIHNHAFVREAADIVYDNMDDAIAYLLKLA